MKLHQLTETELEIEAIHESEDRVRCVLKPVDRFFRNSQGFATALQTGMARKALQQYMKHKGKYTAQFFAGTDEEKQLYSAIVKDLMASNQYTLKKNRSEGGVWIWELQRKRGDTDEN